MKTTHGNSIVLTLLLVSCAGAEDADEIAKRRLKVLNEVYKKLQTTDSYQVFADIESEGTPLEIAQRYSALNSGLFRNKYDIPRMLVVGQAAVRFCLRESARLEKDDPELSKKLKMYAKGMAYNLSANVWPAWAEEKMKIRWPHIVVGLDLARLNLRLANELKPKGSGIGNAHWLLGAQHLALKHPEQAIKQFRAAAAEFKKAELPDYEHMAIGYESIAKITAEADSGEEQKLNDTIAKLKEMDTRDSRFFASQLKQVLTYFTKKSASTGGD